VTKAEIPTKSIDSGFARYLCKKKTKKNFPKKNLKKVSRQWFCALYMLGFRVRV
jgi:hypothetical protein